MTDIYPAAAPPEEDLKNFLLGRFHELSKRAIYEVHDVLVGDNPLASDASVAARQVETALIMIQVEANRGGPGWLETVRHLASSIIARHDDLQRLIKDPTEEQAAALQVLGQFIDEVATAATWLMEPSLRTSEMPPHPVETSERVDPLISWIAHIDAATLQLPQWQQQWEESRAALTEALVSRTVASADSAHLVALLEQNLVRVDSAVTEADQDLAQWLLVLQMATPAQGGSSHDAGTLKQEDIKGAHEALWVLGARIAHAAQTLTVICQQVTGLSGVTGERASRLLKILEQFLLAAEPVETTVVKALIASPADENTKNQLTPELLTAQFEPLAGARDWARGHDVDRDPDAKEDERGGLILRQKGKEKVVEPDEEEAEDVVEPDEYDDGADVGGSGTDSLAIASTAELRNTGTSQTEWADAEHPHKIIVREFVDTLRLPMMHVTRATQLVIDKSSEAFSTQWFDHSDCKEPWTDFSQQFQLRMTRLRAAWGSLEQGESLTEAQQVVNVLHELAQHTASIEVARLCSAMQGTLQIVFFEARPSDDPVWDTASDLTHAWEQVLRAAQRLVITVNVALEKAGENQLRNTGIIEIGEAVEFPPTLREAVATAWAAVPGPIRTREAKSKTRHLNSIALDRTPEGRQVGFTIRVFGDDCVVHIGDGHSAQLSALPVQVRGRITVEAKGKNVFQRLRRRDPLNFGSLKVECPPHYNKINCRDAVKDELHAISRKRVMFHSSVLTDEAADS